MIKIIFSTIAQDLIPVETEHHGSGQVLMSFFLQWLKFLLLNINNLYCGCFPQMVTHWEQLLHTFEGVTVIHKRLNSKQSVKLNH